ncbi:MAG TPA: hypothetical protein VIG36_11965 [Methylocystis sp.]
MRFELLSDRVAEVSDGGSQNEEARPASDERQSEEQPVITNTAVTQSDPFPQGFGFVEVDPPSFALPPDGTVTTKTISTIL